MPQAPRKASASGAADQRPPDPRGQRYPAALALPHLPRLRVPPPPPHALGPVPLPPQDAADPCSSLCPRRGTEKGSWPPTGRSLTLKGLLRSESAKGLLSKSGMAGTGGRYDHWATALPLQHLPPITDYPPPLSPTTTT